MIDIGGPSMLRGAAKNFAHVAPVCQPEQYDERARPSCARTASSRSRRAGAWRRRRSRTTAAYEAAIAALVRRAGGASPTRSLPVVRRR